jgi:hypothetical protein
LNNLLTGKPKSFSELKLSQIYGCPVIPIIAHFSFCFADDWKTKMLNGKGLGGMIGWLVPFPSAINSNGLLPLSMNGAGAIGPLFLGFFPTG